MIKAIETSYKGYRFRSRLEARWAVFFDAMEIKWQYEPEGFQKTTMEDGEVERVVRYLPDFYLPETGTWVEVKGVWTEKDAEDTIHILDYGSPLWNFDECDSGLWKFKDRQEAGAKSDVRGLLILGDIPDIRHGRVFHPLVTHYKGLWMRFAEFNFSVPGKMRKVDQEVVDLGKSIQYGPGGPIEPIDAWAMSPGQAHRFMSTNYVPVELKWANKKLSAAYTAARSARFEHGQSGALA